MAVATAVIASSPAMAVRMAVNHVRTPRGKGKKETGALYNIHPQNCSRRR